MDDGKDAWQELAARYRDGTAALHTTKRPVREPDLDAPIDPDTGAAARRAREYYEREGYLPPLDNREHL